MGQKARGGLWCPACNTPRVGCGIRVPDPVPVIDLALLSFGAVLDARKHEKHVCATCGIPLVYK
jgi:hypothetical protein